MTRTTFQNTSLNLQVGVPVSINLANFSSNATSFAIVNTSQAYNANLAGGGLPNGLTMNSAGLITGTPTTPQVVVCRARAYRGSRSPDSSWNARKAGAYNSQRFDDPNAVLLAGGISFDRSANQVFDSTIKRSGAGSMHQFLPAGTPANGPYAGWYFSTKIPQITSGFTAFSNNTGFAPGEEFWIQYSVRFDRNTVQYAWGNFPKISILDMLPWTGDPSAGPTAEDWEHVIVPGHGTCYGYINGVDGEPWFGYHGHATTTEGDGVYHPSLKNTSRVLNGDNPGMASGAGPSWTSAQQERGRNSLIFEKYTSLGNPDGRPDPLMMPGPAFAHDQWHTILQHVKVSTGPATADLNPSTGQSTPGTPWLSANGTYEVYLAQEGQDYVKLFGETAYSLRVTSTTSPNFFRRATGNSQSTVFSGLFLTNLIYQLDFSAGPQYNQWIDEIICSPTAIPAPDFDGTGNYRTADTLLTFKVT